MTHFVYKVLRSFIFAFQGIISGARERNMKVHLIAVIVVSLTGLWVQLQLWEWFVVFILFGLVTSAEMVNTAVEELANIVRDELKLSYKATQRARDVAAGAVLIQAIIASIIAGAIFLPKIIFMMK